MPSCHKLAALRASTASFPSSPTNASAGDFTKGIEYRAAIPRPMSDFGNWSMNFVMMSSAREYFQYAVVMAAMRLRGPFGAPNGSVGNATRGAGST